MSTALVFHRYYELTRTAADTKFAERRSAHHEPGRGQITATTAFVETGLAG